MAHPALTSNRVGIATYEDYAGAQRAVDYLSDQKFPVETVQIVGSDLRMVEQVVGRQSWGTAALRGVATGAWIGLFVGLLLSIVVPGISLLPAILWGLLNGAIFGLVFGLLTYALTGGRRDFVSRSGIVPSHYDVLVEANAAERARSVLAGLGERH